MPVAWPSPVPATGLRVLAPHPGHALPGPDHVFTGPAHVFTGPAHTVVP